MRCRVFLGVLSRGLQTPMGWQATPRTCGDHQGLQLSRVWSEATSPGPCTLLTPGPEATWSPVAHPSRLKASPSLDISGGQPSSPDPGTLQRNHDHHLPFHP